MKKNSVEDDDMRPEYDFSGGVRGTHYKRYRQGVSVRIIDDDVEDQVKVLNQRVRKLERDKDKLANRLGRLEDRFGTLAKPIRKRRAVLKQGRS